MAKTVRGRAGSGITVRHCKCKQCVTDGRRTCPKSCSHRNRFQVRKQMPDGSRPTRWFNTREEAERHAAELTLTRTHQKVDRTLDRHSRLFGEAVDGWLANRERKMNAGRLAVRTFSEDQTVVERHLKPVFGPTRLNQIGVDEVQDVVDVWTAEVSPSEVRKRYNKLAMILRSEAGTEFNTKDTDAVNGILLPRKTTAERVYLESKDELGTLIEAVPEPYKLLVKFAAIVGTRTPGETFELRAGDIINGSRMSVSRAVRRGHKTPDNPTGFVVQGTKTHQQRIVGVPAWLLDEVKAQLGTRLSDPEALLFADENGDWLDYDRFMNEWRKAVKVLPEHKRDLQPYGLRHTCASFLANEGVPIWQVSKQLGHSSTAVTERSYARLFPAGIDATATALDGYRL